MQDDPTTGTRPEPDVPSVGVLVERYSRGKEELINYLREPETAEYLIGLVAEETGIKRIFVRAGYNILVSLVVNEMEAGARKLAGRLLDASARVLERLPFYNRIARALLRLEERLSREQDLRGRLNALLAGRIAAARFGDAQGLSREARVGLRILEEQEALWAEIDHGFDEISGALGRLNQRPPLTIRALSTEAAELSVNRLRPNARRVPFVGRAKELQDLDVFLAAERRFCWWAVTGPGGLGKSRLALELCVKRNMDWRAGFLRREATYDRWHSWQPETRTLIILDYAGTQVERARRIVTALRDRQAELDAPVRLLLLERSAEGENWWRRFLTTDTTGAEIRDSCFKADAAPLQLGELSDEDLWAMICFVMGAASKSPTNREVILRELLLIDPGRRPLFAALAADSLASGRSLRGWDRTRLLEDVLAREQQSIWPADVTPAELNLLALATMCSSLSILEVEQLSTLPILPKGFLPDFDPDAASSFRPDRYARMAGQELEDHKERGLLLPPLEPGIIGEFFVLRHMTDANGRVMRRRAERLRDAAWAAPRTRALGFGHFLARCAEDFLDEPALRVLLELPSESQTIAAQRFWTLAALSQIIALGRANRIDESRLVYRQLMDLATSRAEDEKIVRMAVGAAGSFLQALINDKRVDEAKAVYAEIEARADEHADDVELSSLEAGSAVSLLEALITTDRLDEALIVYRRLAAMAAKSKRHLDLRLHLAHVSPTLVSALIGSGRLDEAQVVKDQFAKLVAANPEPVAGVDLRTCVGTIAIDLLLGFIRAGRIDEAAELQGQLRTLATQWPLPQVINQAASGAICAISGQVAAGRIGDARAMRGWLVDVAASQPNDADLQLAAFAGSEEFMIGLALTGSMDEALEIFDSLIDQCRASPEEASWRLSLFERTFRLCLILNESDHADQLPAVYEHLKVLRALRPSIGELRFTEGRYRFHMLQELLTADSKEELLTQTLHDMRHQIAPGGELRRVVERRLQIARQVLDWLLSVATFGANVSPQLAEEWELRATPDKEAELQLMVGRGAAALIGALLEVDLQGDAEDVALRAEPMLRSAALGSWYKSAGQEAVHAKLVALLNGLTTRNLNA